MSTILTDWKQIEEVYIFDNGTFSSMPIGAKISIASTHSSLNLESEYKFHANLHVYNRKYGDSWVYGDTFKENDQEIINIMAKMPIEFIEEGYESVGSERNFRTVAWSFNNELHYTNQQIVDSRYVSLIAPLRYNRKYYYESFIVGGLPGYFMEPGIRMSRTWNNYVLYPKNTYTH